MTDELVERPSPKEAIDLLRLYARKHKLPPRDNNFEDAASIIEELTTRAEKAEAQLAKAVEVLRGVVVARDRRAFAAAGTFLNRLLRKMAKEPDALVLQGETRDTVFRWPMVQLSITDAGRAALAERKP